MGRVFSWEDVSRKRIPTTEAITEVADEIRAAIHSSPAHVGGILCGSVLNGEHTRRSDIDLVTIYYPSARAEAIALERQLLWRAGFRHVQLNIAPQDRDLTETPFHNIEFLFGEHLTRASRGLGAIGEDPISYFSFSHTSALRDASWYIQKKLRSFDDGERQLRRMTQERYFTFLEKVLEVPVHLARKMLHVRGIPLVHDGKREVLAAYDADIAGERAARLLSHLARLNARYSDVLMGQLRHPDKGSYQEMLKEIEAAAPLAFEFVKLNALALSHT